MPPLKWSRKRGKQANLCERLRGKWSKFFFNFVFSGVYAKILIDKIAKICG
jgi:hypothetical protein